MNNITEQDSLYHNLSEMSAFEIIESINTEDQKVAIFIKNELKSIENLVNTTVEKMKLGGRLFYIGAGTSGRLGILDASECPPTYGVPFDMVIGIIAGGDSAIRKAVEFAEDDTNQAIKDLNFFDVSEQDVVVGISASGRTPYVLGGLMQCNALNITTACICCNKNSIIAQNSKFPIEVELGPEVVTGSTRMKSGTAQKMILNMISTAVMIRLGKVKGSKMIDMQLSNDKLIDRGTKMVMLETLLDYEDAKTILIQEGSVRKAIDWIKLNTKP